MSDNSRVRVSIVGVVIVALFASLFVRLWFLQMGPEQKLGQVVSTLATRVIQTESPRGEILDRNGKVLAQDVAAWAVTVDRNLSKTTLDRVLGQLAEVLKVDEKTLRANYTSVRQSPLKPAIVKLDVPLPAQLAIREHSEDYPGVNVAELTVRKYPYDGYASQLLGYLGEVDAVSKDQFKQLQSKGYQAGDLIGRDGVESAYESELRGKPRRETVQVDPTGKQIGAPISVDPGTVGDNVKLTIDIKVQVQAEKALVEGIGARARTAGPGAHRPRFPLLEADGWGGGRAQRARRVGARDGEQPDVPALGLDRWHLRQQLRSAERAGRAQSSAEPRHAGSVRPRLDVQARPCGRADSLWRAGAVAVHQRRRFVPSRDDDLPQRQRRPQRPGRPFEGADGLERHLLLPSRRRVLEPLEGRGHQDRLGHPDRCE